MGDLLTLVDPKHHRIHHRNCILQFFSSEIKGRSVLNVEGVFLKNTHRASFLWLQIALSGNGKNGLSVCVIRPTGIFGPRDENFAEGGNERKSVSSFHKKYKTTADYSAARGAHQTGRWANDNTRTFKLKPELGMRATRERFRSRRGNEADG